MSETFQIDEMLSDRDRAIAANSDCDAINDAVHTLMLTDDHRGCSLFVNPGNARILPFIVSVNRGQPLPLMYMGLPVKFDAILGSTEWVIKDGDQSAKAEGGKE
jgi:hypothetical protein